VREILAGNRPVYVDPDADRRIRKHYRIHLDF